MDPINGADRLLYIKIDGFWMPVGCLTGNGLSENADMMDTTTRDSEGWATSKPVQQSYLISFTGIQLNSTMPGGTFTVASYDRLKLLKRARIKLDWKLQGSKFPIVDFGKCYISSLDDSENIGEFMSFSGVLTGFGKPQVQDLNITVLNNGDPNVLIVTDEDADTIIQVNNVNQA